MPNTESPSSRTLLPSGFPDMCYPASERHYLAMHALTMFFMQHGYLYTKPPLIEFAENLCCGDAAVRRTLLRATDPLSKETIAVRTDITSQISRIVADSDISQGYPLRLCYSGQVARVTPDYAGGLRERTQVGAECIGGTLVEAMTEIAELLLRNLRRFGIEGAVMDIGLPELVRRCIDMMRLSPSEEEAFRYALAVKDKKTVADMLASMDVDGVDAAWLTGLADMNEDALAALPEGLRVYVNIAYWAVDELRKRFPDVTFRVDPADVKHFPYHRDMVFSVYAPGNGRELARGGHYIVSGQDAVGVTLYIEDICAAAGDAPEKTMVSVTVPRQLSYRRVAALVKDGYRIHYAGGALETPAALKKDAIASGSAFYCTLSGELLPVA